MEFWKKHRLGFGIYLAHALIIIYICIKRSEFISFDKSLELISIYTAAATFASTTIVIFIDIVVFIMLLSDWISDKLKRRDKIKYDIASESIRQKLLMDLIEAEQRGLSLSEIIDELKLPKKIELLDFQTLNPFNLTVSDTIGNEFDLKNIVWITITLKENSTFSLCAITKGEDINGLPDITNNVMLISEEEYKRIKDIVDNF